MTEAQLALLMALADLVKEIPLPTHGDGSAMRRRINSARKVVHEEATRGRSIQGAPELPDHDPIPDEISAPEVEMPSTTTVFVQIGAWRRGITTAQARILRDELTQKFPLPPPGIPRHKNYVWLSDEVIASRPTGKVVWINPGDGKAIVAAPNSQPFTVWHEDELRKLAADVGDLVLPPAIAPISENTLRMADTALQDQLKIIDMIGPVFTTVLTEQPLSRHANAIDAARREIQLHLG